MDSSAMTLHDAAKLGKIDCLKELLANGASPNQRDKDGKTALMLAVQEGNIDCLKELLANGADPNLADMYR